MLRSESPRDYVDILRSMKYRPTINIADIAHNIAKIGNRIEKGFFSPDEGRLTEPDEEKILAAQQGRLQVSMPMLDDDRPVVTNDPSVHPITGSSCHYMLFDWFHQSNTKVPVEALRRASAVKELRGIVNTQAAEQLHRDKSRDVYFFNQMKPFNHVFTFKLITHLKNQLRNKKILEGMRKHVSEVGLNQLGQIIDMKSTCNNPSVSLPNTDKTVSIKPCHKHRNHLVIYLF